MKFSFKMFVFFLFWGIVLTKTNHSDTDWTCEPERFGDGKICDCGCGAYDPDCDVREMNDETGEVQYLPSNCDDLSFRRPSTCEKESGEFKCVYRRLIKVPEDWTCSPEKYLNEDKICYCNCGVFDPTCRGSRKVEGCEYDHYEEWVICSYINEERIVNGTDEDVIIPKKIPRCYVYEKLKPRENLDEGEGKYDHNFGRNEVADVEDMDALDLLITILVCAIWCGGGVVFTIVWFGLIFFWRRAKEEREKEANKNSATETDLVTPGNQSGLEQDVDAQKESTDQPPDLFLQPINGENLKVDF